jgi:glycerol-3-phosphate dehydrogenase (NAD(P)+)
VRIAVVGGGAWGTALASHAARIDHDVVMWAVEPEVADDVTTRHENTTYLPGVRLPPSLRASTDAAQVVAGAELVLLVPPSEHLRPVATRVAPAMRDGALVVVATKGIEEKTHALMTDVVRQSMPRVGAEHVVVLSGPSFAREVASGLPTDVVAAATAMDAARAVQSAWRSGRTR